MDRNKAKILAFSESWEARGHSIPSVDKFANHPIVVERLCIRGFNVMNTNDGRELIVKLKNIERKKVSAGQEARGTGMQSIH